MLNKGARATEMDEDTFEALIDRHGGGPDRWPAEDRAPAAALLARSAAARALLAEAAELDALLRADAAPAAQAMEAGAPEMQTMAARAMRAPQRRAVLPRWRGDAGRVALGGFGLAAALVLAAGLTLGVAGARARDGVDEAPSQLLASALDARGGGVGDVE